MGNFQQIVYLSQSEYGTLTSEGTITKDGRTITYNEDNLYVTPDNGQAIYDSDGNAITTTYVKNTALENWSGSSNITTVGTLSSGTVPLSIVGDAADLKAIEALSGTSGFLKKTAADTWSLDTTSYVSDVQVNGSSVVSSGVANISITTDLTQMTGVLPISKGGTGESTGADAANALINSLSTGSDTPTDSDYIITQYVGGSKTTYHRRQISKLWTYIKNKIDSIYTFNKVKQTVKTDNVNYKLLATISASPTSGADAEATYSTNIYANPSTGAVSAVRHTFNVSGTDKAYMQYNSSDESIDFIFI